MRSRCEVRTVPTNRYRAEYSGAISSFPLSRQPLTERVLVNGDAKVGIPIHRFCFLHRLAIARNVDLARVARVHVKRRWRTTDCKSPHHRAHRLIIAPERTPDYETAVPLSKYGQSPSAWIFD